jgi:hypothetical protein
MAADLNKRHANGKTALMYSKHEATAKRLVEEGVDAFVVDNVGMSALDYSILNLGMKHKQTQYLALVYLEQLFLYLHRTQSRQICLDIEAYINDENAPFPPLGKCHLLALRVVESELEQYTYLSDFYFIGYFVSNDFREKCLNDVRNKLAADNVEVNGQLLIGMRVRAKTEAEMEVIEALAERVRLRYELVNEFYELTLKLSPFIVINTNRMINKNLEVNETMGDDGAAARGDQDDFEAKLNEHLRVDHSAIVLVYITL